MLDLGDVPPEQARRVPLATWYRFRLQAEKSRTLFLLITRSRLRQQLRDGLAALPAGGESTGSRRQRPVRHCSPDCVTASAWSAAEPLTPTAQEAGGFGTSGLEQHYLVVEMSHARPRCISVCMFATLPRRPLARSHPELRSRPLPIPAAASRRWSMSLRMNERARQQGVELDMSRVQAESFPG